MEWLKIAEMNFNRRHLHESLLNGSKFCSDLNLIREKENYICLMVTRVNRFTKTNLC